MLIVIDPGHGWSNSVDGKYDPGAVSGSESEAKIVMAWAATLKFLLVQKGLTVKLTRTSDTDHAKLSRRISAANAAGADLYISLHCNAASASARGTETLYRDGADKALAKVIQAAAIKAFRSFDQEWKDRGVKPESESARGKLAVFGMNCPAALLEIGFISNSQDRVLMLRKDVRVAVCQAIADAVAEMIQ
jgi:N-acetylmuramoyl-L-alanine amidase